MTTLKFRNLVFKTGVNLTVRRGTKWCGAESDVPTEFGYYIRSANPPLDANGNEEIWGFAEITETAVFRFKDIPEHLLADEHSPECRTWAGLQRAMKEIYPRFHESEICTLVWFFPSK